MYFQEGVLVLVCIALKACGPRSSLSNARPACQCQRQIVSEMHASDVWDWQTQLALSLLASRRRGILVIAEILAHPPPAFEPAVCSLRPASPL